MPDDLVGIPQKPLRAVHDADLEGVLRNLGLLESLRQGQLQCGVCGNRVTLETLRCIYPEGTKIKVCCDRPECFEKAFEKVEAK